MKRSVTVALATLCLLLPGTMAGADPGGTSQSGDAKTMRQLAAVRAAAEKIHSVVDEDQSGYAGLVVSPASSEVHLYWHGPLPAEVQDVLRDLATHVTVRVTSAEYTLSQLRAETLRLVGTSRSDGTVVWAAPLPDGSGVKVRVNSGTASVRPLAGTSTVRTVVERGGAPVPLSRWADSPPFFGGAVIERDDRPGFITRCSTAFGGRALSRQVVLTAAHCGTPGQNWRTPRGTFVPSIPVGRAIARLTEQEAMFIEAGSGPFIYDGDADGSGIGQGEFIEKVTGRARPDLGDFLCQSGGFSGVRCGLQVTNGHVVYLLDGFLVDNGIEVERRDHASASGSGDSGGPVFSQSGTPGEVRAAGVVSAGDPDTQTTCTGISPPGRLCVWRMIYADLTQIESRAGFELSIG